METLCVKLAAEKDGGIPANEMVVQIAVGRIEEVSEQAAPTSKKQKGGRSSVAPIGFAQTVDEPDFLEFPLPAGSMLEIAEQQVVDEVIAPSAPWLAAEKVLEKEASRYHETKQIEAGQSVGKKRARPVDHGSYTSKGAGEVSATFRITLQVRVVARNQTGSSDVSETSTIAIERAASKPVPEVASPAPIAVPPVDDVDVVMATEGADGPGKSDSMEELVRKVPIFQQLVENYTGEEEDEAMVEEPVHLAAAATPSRSELRDSEIVPETPVAHAPKADIPAALAPAKPSSPIRNGWNLPVNAEAAPSEVAPETEPDEVIEEAAGSVKRVSGRQSTEPDEEEGAGSVLVQPTPEPTAEPALEQAEELAPEPAAEPAAESVPEPAPQQPVEMEVHQATSKKAVKSRQSLPANFAVGPKETATKTPSGKRPPAKKEAATTVKKGRKSAAMDDEPVESEPVIAKPVKAAPKPESSAPPSWDPLALRFGDDVNLIFDEFNRPFFYKALWYCDADLLTGPFGKKEVVDTGKVLVLHGAGFGADNLVWVFLNEEGLRSLTPGDVSKVDPLDMPEKLNWDELKAVFNVKSHDFFFGLPETWGIRQEDLPAIRDGPWHRKIWSVKRAPQHVIMAQKGNIKANVESAFKKARKSGVGTDLAPVADKPTPKRNVKAKKEKDAAGTDEEETY